MRYVYHIVLTLYPFTTCNIGNLWFMTFNWVNLMYISKRGLVCNASYWNVLERRAWAPRQNDQMEIDIINFLEYDCVWYKLQKPDVVFYNIQRTLTCKNDFGFVFGNALYIVSPLAGELACSLTTFNTLICYKQKKIVSTNILMITSEDVTQVFSLPVFMGKTLS